MDERAGKSSYTNEATYLAGFDSRHSGIVVNNGEVAFYLLLLSKRNPVHISSLDEVVIRLLVLSNPLIMCRSLKSNRGIGEIFHSAIHSVIEYLDLAFKGVGVVKLLVSVSVDTCLFGVGTGGSGQPVHSGLVTLLGVVKVREIYSVVDTDSMTYMPDWEPVPKCKREQMGRWLPIGWAEFGESSTVIPSNGSAGRTELNASLGRHIVA